MADAPDPEVYFAIFQTHEVPTLIQELLRLERIYLDQGRRVMEDGVGQIINRFLTDLQALAASYVVQVDAAIKEKIHATRWSSRPSRDEMETHIVSETGPFGGVGVAKISELDRIVNPEGQWGPYWRAQEYGTGWGKYKQEGRRLFGTFYESETPPEGAQRGAGEGTDLYFLPMGSAPGLGRISVELPARHFLRDGAIEVGDKWKDAMKVLERGVIDDLTSLHASGRATRGGRTFIGRIEA